MIFKTKKMHVSDDQEKLGGAGSDANVFYSQLHTIPFPVQKTREKKQKRKKKSTMYIFSFHLPAAI